MDQLKTESTNATVPDDNEPTPERQAELRMAYEANVAAGRPPYAGVVIHTRGEVTWILRERGWTGAYDAATIDELETLNRGQLQLPPLQNEVPDLFRVQAHEEVFEPADLREAVLASAILGDIQLRRANLNGANLMSAVLAQASFTDATLCGARLRRADLRDASLRYADLSKAYLREANLTGADLTYANLAGSRLLETYLLHANLRAAVMDSTTILVHVKLDSETRLLDVIWNGVSLAQVEWEQARTLGDEKRLSPAQIRAPEEVALSASGETKRAAFLRIAARSYRALANTLFAQGLTIPARRYRTHEQRLERKALFWSFAVGPWLFSSALNIVSGYGDRPLRALGVYLAVILTFAGIYFGITTPGSPIFFTGSQPLQLHEAVVFSLSSFHGRGFFPSAIGLGDPVAIVAALEAVVGLFIELVLIATFTRRLFER